MRARGRYAGYVGPRSVSSRNPGAPVLAALSAVLLLAACGGLESPDLSTGQVSGRLVGAKPGAFAYALGKANTKAELDADGFYTIRGVPVTATGTASIVLFDGANRADIVGAPVKAAMKTRADDADANTLRQARSVSVTARCAYDIKADGVTYEVEGVALRDEARGSGGTLFPIPQGSFTVRARASGMKPKEIPVDVSSDDDSVEFDMEVEDSDTSHRGCLSNGCAGDLQCDGDGGCYSCTSDTQCGAGYKCSNHQCKADGGDGASVCASCSSDSSCAKGPAGLSQPGMCISVGGSGNVCSHGCTADVDCPSGLACTQTSKGTACTPLPTSSCAAFLQGAGFGVTCTSTNKDTACAGVADAKCLGADSNGAQGYCTSRCTVPTDCPTGFQCDLVNRVCTF